MPGPLDDHYPEALAFSRTCQLGGHLKSPIAYFDRRLWVREQVVVPVRVRPPLPGLGTGVSEKQERLSCEGSHSTLVRSKLIEDLAVPV